MDTAILTTLLDASPSAEFWLDDGLRVRWVSRAAEPLFGCSLTELMGRDFSTLVVEGDRSDCAAWLAGDMAGSFPCRLAAGSRQRVRLYGQHLAGPVTGMRVSVVVEPPLEEDDRLQRLASAIAHDFNNVLGSVGVFSQLLQGSDLPSPEASFVDHLLVACRLGQNFTANLQVLAGRRAARPSTVSLRQVVQGIESVLRGMLLDGFSFVLDLAEEERPVLVDTFFVEQALINLVKNAREAMPSGGTITLRSGLQSLDTPRPGPLGEVPVGTYMALQLQDQGRGIPATLHPVIWDITYTTKESKAGIGLGLWVVRRIMQMSGGHLLLDSIEGGGSTFILLFPCHNRSD